MSARYIFFNSSFRAESLINPVPIKEQEENNMRNAPLIHLFPPQLKVILHVVRNVHLSLTCC